MNKLLIEFLGSAFLVFIILSIGNPIAVGLTVTLISIIGMKESVGHYNPIVSAVMASTGEISMSDLATFSIAQLLGAFVGLEISKRLQI